ncbi:hypothetical protein [Methylovirgula sp. 4M-Z18]|uniref:hypothetical protein n=1 Tax=Methylovirgula sp. 4M-Z18 TaxID=2293567 RepID=UPI0030D27CFA
MARRRNGGIEVLASANITPKTEGNAPIRKGKFMLKLLLAVSTVKKLDEIPGAIPRNSGICPLDEYGARQN